MTQSPNRFTSDRSDEPSQPRQMGTNLAQTVIAACQGSQEAATQLEPFLDDLAQQDDWRELAAMLRRVLEGERDPNVLLPGLDVMDTLVVRQVLRGLGEEEPPSSAYDPDVHTVLTHLRQQWQPVIEVVIIAAQAEGRRPEGLDTLLEQLDESDDWHELAGALRRIVEGERAPQALFPGLSGAEALIVGEVLRGLGVETGTPRMLGPEAEGPGREVNLDDLFTMVAQASRPDAPPEMGEQLHAITDRVARDPEAPDELRALCRVLNRVLAGDRDPDLSDLPPGLAQRARRMLASI